MTALASFRVMPVAAEAVRVVVVITPADWIIDPVLETRFTFWAGALTLSVSVRFPALVKLMLPDVVLLTAPRLVTMLGWFRVTPVTAEAVNAPAVIAADWPIEPVLETSETV